MNMLSNVIEQNILVLTIKRAKWACRNLDGDFALPCGEQHGYLLRLNSPAVLLLKVRGEPDWLYE
jgi:hypothetical protein